MYGLECWIVDLVWISIHSKWACLFVKFLRLAAWLSQVWILHLLFPWKRRILARPFLCAVMSGKEPHFYGFAFSPYFVTRSSQKWMEWAAKMHFFLFNMNQSDMSTSCNVLQWSGYCLQSHVMDYFGVCDGCYDQGGSWWGWVCCSIPWMRVGFP